MISRIFFSVIVFRSIFPHCVLKKLRSNWFDEIFFRWERISRVFPHCEIPNSRFHEKIFWSVNFAKFQHKKWIHGIFLLKHFSLISTFRYCRWALVRLDGFTKFFQISYLIFGWRSIQFVGFRTYISVILENYCKVHTALTDLKSSE